MRALRRMFPVFFAAMLPLSASAQANAAPTTFAGLANTFVQIISATTALLIGVGVAYYLWGLTDTMRDPGSAKSKEELRRRIIWGVLIFFVMFFVWGIVRVLGNTLFGGTSYMTLTQ